jgi:hypothetical protein
LIRVASVPGPEQGVIEVAEIVVPGAHPPPAVQQEQHGLVALVLIVPGDRFAGAGGGLPVDLPQAVADAVFAQLEESLTLAAPPSAVNPHQRLAPVRGEPDVAGDGGEIGIDPHRGRFTQPGVALPQPAR